MAKELEDNGNPFSPQNAPAVNLIVSMRIYDALMALLQTQDEETHDRLNALHEAGKVAWSVPWIDLTDSDDDSVQSGVQSEDV
jgi:hypothetical protein